MTYLERMRPRPGLRVLITAGAGGLGAAIAEAFIEAGAKVAICDLSQDGLERFQASHPGAVAMQADVAQEDQVGALFDEVQAQFGGLDVLVNNAGIAGPTGPIDDLPLAEIRKTLDIDLMGQFLTTSRAAPLLRQSDEGAIVNISSVAGRLGYPLRTPYAAAKWGIVGLTKSLAQEMGPYGVRVNAILPGPVRGERMDGVIRDRAEAAGVSFAEMEAAYLSRISLRRMVGPADVANLALYLCSAAGANISGQAISLCGNLETL